MPEQFLFYLGILLGCSPERFHMMDARSVRENFYSERVSRQKEN